MYKTSMVCILLLCPFLTNFGQDSLQNRINLQIDDKSVGRITSKIEGIDKKLVSTSDWTLARIQRIERKVARKSESVDSIWEEENNSSASFWSSAYFYTSTGVGASGSYYGFKGNIAHNEWWWQQKNGKWRALTPSTKSN